MGRKIEGDEKRRKSNSRSIRNKNIRKFPLFPFFLVGVEGKKNMGVGAGGKKRKF